MTELTQAEIFILMRGLNLLNETRLSDDDREVVRGLAYKLGGLTADVMLAGSGIIKTAPDVPRA